MKGWRTLAWGLGMALVPAGLQYLGGVDWTQYVSPTVASVVAGSITVLLRAFTNTPLGHSR